MLMLIASNSNVPNRPSSSRTSPNPKIRCLPARAKPLWYTPRMTTADTKRIERIARESADLARKSLRKSNEIEAYLSVGAGKVRRHKSHSATDRPGHVADPHPEGTEARDRLRRSIL